MIKVPVQGKRNPVASSIFLVKDQLFKILPKFEPYFSINGGGGGGVMKTGGGCGASRLLKAVRFTVSFTTMVKNCCNLIYNKTD
jgi:hypothetical protein